MDDFHYEDIPSCVAPTNLAASNITGEVLISHGLQVVMKLFGTFSGAMQVLH